jgi:2-oxo-4-hydroxy-4-carboxy-5-ureidoimidazoline decarboxylase
VEPLADFNALPPDEVERELLTCCASPRWARRMAAGRPYPDLQALKAAGGAALAALTWEDIAEALSAHPRIGQRIAGAGRDDAWSRREQSGMDDADADVKAALLRANTDYERRFDHVFLIFATGKTPAEMLAAARQRLGNDEAAEREVVRAELDQIIRLRLERLVTR